ncbi:MAG: rhodanese-like domain-containing protein [Ignavibacteriales bacterium]|nr:rhodanese-like domain-containing protein [Ignavibacteriales bacterium]
MLRQAIRESLLVLFAASVLGFSYTAFSEKGFFQQKKPTRLRQLAALAPSMVSLQEAKALFDSGAVFLDARHAFEFKQGHIRGAINIPLNDFDKKKEELRKIASEKVIVTYCDGVDCNSSIALAAKLHEAGYTNVKIFFSGWQDWTANNLPTESSQ